MSLISQLMSKCLLPRPQVSCFVIFEGTRKLHTGNYGGLCKEITNGFGPWDQKQPLGSGGDKVYGWPAYNERVHLPNGEYRPAYVCHMRDNIKYTHKKMWYIADFVRGLSVDEALKQLQFINKKGARIAEEVIQEARELAVKEHHVEFRTNLWVAESFARKGMVMKGVRRHARGRIATIRYEYMHYFVRLEEGPPPPNFRTVHHKKFDAQRMLAEYVQEHREKVIPLS